MMTMMNMYIISSWRDHPQEAGDVRGWVWVVGSYMGYKSLFSFCCLIFWLGYISSRGRLTRYFKRYGKSGISRMDSVEDIN